MLNSEDIENGLPLYVNWKLRLWSTLMLMHGPVLHLHESPFMTHDGLLPAPNMSTQRFPHSMIGFASYRGSDVFVKRGEDHNLGAQE